MNSENSDLNSIDESSIGESSIDEVTHEVVADTLLLANAIGGWRGVVDSALPSIAFLLVYLLDDHNLRMSIYIALGVGAALAIERVIKKASLQQVLSGLFGVAISAYITGKTGQAQNFFLPGIITNAVYGSVCLISVLIRKPLLGFVIGGMRGQDTSWLRDPSTRRTYSTVTWLWTAIFTTRVLVMFPLYLMGAVGILGVLKLVLGWPLYLLGVYVSYLIVRAKPLS